MKTEREIQNSPVSREDQKRIADIRKAIKAEGKAIRAKYPWLVKYQDWIGLSLLLGSASAMGGLAILYLQGFIPAVAAILAIAFVTSVAHELEHDTIHRAYFTKSKAMQNFFFAVVWLMRPGTVSPWVRKHLHLMHHKISGSEGDIEERAITNGEPWNIKRVIMMADGFLSALLRVDWKQPQLSRARIASMLKSYFPLGIAYYLIWWMFLTYHAFAFVFGLFGFEIVLHNENAGMFEVVEGLVVIFIAPHFIRSLCINFVSSNMHYYGDVEKGNVIKQTQIIDSWLFFPFHLFCFNFGKTHGLHHFWAVDPFYIRNAIASKVRPVMEANGVRVNDFASMGRANRYGTVVGNAKA